MTVMARCTGTATCRQWCTQTDSNIGTSTENVIETVICLQRCGQTDSSHGGSTGYGTGTVVCLRWLIRTAATSGGWKDANRVTWTEKRPAGRWRKLHGGPRCVPPLLVQLLRCTPNA
jgi:hypothetical protein